MLGFVLRVLAAGVALLVVQGLASGLASALFGPSGVTLPPGSLGWVALSNLLTAAAMTWLGARARPSGLRLAGWLALVLFGVATINNMIEGLFFHVFGTRDFTRYVVQGAVAAAAFALLLVAIAGRMRAPSAPMERAPARPAASWVWRLVAADLLYVACYFGAGIVIYPRVRDFYQGRSLPPQSLIAAMQLFLRGPVFIALMLVVVRLIEGNRWEKALAAGATLSVIGGVAPLLIPNPYLPDAVRWAHFFEVGISNFIYGGVVAWLFTAPPRPLAAPARSSA